MAGAGTTRTAAEAPAVLEGAHGRRVLVSAWGSTTSGIPRSWAPTPSEPGVALLPDLSTATAHRIAKTLRSQRRPNDLVVVSLHWGGNWGYTVPAEHRDFARALVDEGVDLVHGHSSHHPKGIEVYRGRPILYGCGDFLNDYEGIGGREEFRSELVLGYLATFGPSPASRPGSPPSAGRLVSLELLPFRIRRFRLERATSDEARWLGETLERESSRLGASVAADPDGGLWLRW